MQPTVCPIDGKDDQIQKVTAAWSSGSEILHKRLSPPSPPDSNDTRYKDSPEKSPLPSIPYPKYTPPPIIDWNKAWKGIWEADGFLSKIFILFFGVPIISIYYITVLFFPLIIILDIIIILANIFSDFNDKIALAVYGLISILFYTASRAARRKTKKDYQMKYEKITVANLVAESANKQIQTENEQTKQRNLRKRQLLKEAEIQHAEQYDKWQSRLYYRHRHDIVFIPGDARGGVPPEEMRKLL